MSRTPQPSRPSAPTSPRSSRRNLTVLLGERIRDGLTATLDASTVGLLDFTLTTKPGYTAAAMHRIIIEHLEAVERGEIKRLLIEAPPRHGKSEIVSVRFPPWFLGRNPDQRIIATSHTSHLARRFGRQVRNVASSPTFAELFPGVTVARDSSAMDEWNIAGHDGGYLAAGIGGPITGSGAHVALIDDPIKNRQEADSPNYRQTVWDWYNDVLVTRLEGEGAIVLTLTRYHQDDLAGRLLEAEGDDWTVLRLPALADHNDPLGREPGEALWPEKYSRGYLERLRETDTDFAALYQQQPVARLGATFDREWFAEHRYDAGDRGTANLAIARYITWDTAMKDTSTADYSSAVVWDLMPDYMLHVREVYRERLTFPDLPGTIEALATRYNRDEKLRTVVIEDKASGTSAYQTLRQSAPEWLRPMLRPFTPLGSKEYRAAQAAVWSRLGCVRLPAPGEDARWLVDFETELFGFPSASHDDQVDAYSQGILYLERIIEEGYRARTGAFARQAAGAPILPGAEVEWTP